MHHGHFINAATGENVHPSLKSDPVPKFIYKKMERCWAREFVKGSVRICSLAYYRTVEDESGMIADPDEGVAEVEITNEMRETSPMLGMITRGNPPPAGSRLRNEDNRRLVLCASASARVPADKLDPKYDTWVRIEAVPAIDLIHQALIKRAPDATEPVFKRVVYDDLPPIRPYVLFEMIENAMQLNSRWHTKGTKFEPQREVRVGWLASPTLSAKPIVLSVNGLQNYVEVLPSKAARNAVRRAARK